MGDPHHGGIQVAQPVRKAARKTGATPAKPAGSRKQTAPRAAKATARGRKAPSRKSSGGGTPLDRMREICLSLPDTRETLTWGEPHFRVGDKIFAGCGMEKGRVVIGFKLEMDHADAIISDPRFWRAPYVGHKGWVSMDANQVTDWTKCGH
jgi:predicted DNA-binding protein (MmcQ/YjbR family)